MRTFLVRAGALGAAAITFGATAPATLAAEVDEQRPASEATTMVKLADDSVAASNAWAKREGLTIVRRFPQINWVEVHTGMETASAVHELRDDKGVLDTDAQVIGEKLAPAFTPRDPIFSGGLTFSDGTPAAWHMTKINAPAAWDVTRGSSATTIGVVDSEFDTQNPDLQTKLKTGFNTKSGTAEYHTSNVRSTDADIAGGQCPGVHGTHVAGIIAAATDNNKGTSGVSFDNLVLPVRSSFNFSTGAGATDAQFVADSTEAILYLADKGVVAVNMSFGTTRPHDPLRDAIAFAVSKGVTMVGSAGNDQESNQGAINYPAAYPGVIAVAATKPNDDIASFSSNGDYVDIAAPGDAVFSTWDGRCTNGQNIGQFNGDGVTLNAISGTSMSAPVVTGVVGLMKSVRPDLTPAEVEQILTSTARDLGAGGKDPVFGAGLVDANKAVLAAKAYVRPAPPASAPAPTPAPAPAPAPTPAPIAVVKPAAVLKLLGGVTYSVSKGRLSARISCSIACIGSAKATSKGKTLKSTTFSLKAGAKRTLLLKVSRTTLRKLAKGKGKKIGVALTIKTTGVDGRKLTTKRTITIKT